MISELEAVNGEEEKFEKHVAANLVRFSEIKLPFVHIFQIFFILLEIYRVEAEDGVAFNYTFL